VTEFGPDYADAYDSIYRSKDYDGEADLIERILIRYGFVGSRSILDLGCGTGAHALRLAQRGHRVVGIDRSAAMLTQACAKAVAAGAFSLDFQQADIRHLNLGRRFDAVLMMFTVLGYQRDEAELMAALAAARRHLGPRGVLLFDVWYGPAVLADRPGERNIRVAHGSGSISRKTRALLDVSRRLCQINFELERVDGRGRTEKWQEEHFVHYYFRPDLERALGKSQLQLLDLSGFPDETVPADERTWNVLGVARAIEGS